MQSVDLKGLTASSKSAIVLVVSTAESVALCKGEISMLVFTCFWNHGIYKIVLIGKFNLQNDGLPLRKIMCGCNGHSLLCNYFESMWVPIQTMVWLVLSSQNNLNHSWGLVPLLEIKKITNSIMNLKNIRISGWNLVLKSSVKCFKPKTTT